MLVEKTILGISCSSVVRTRHFHYMARAESLVRELRSHELQSKAKKQRKRKKDYPFSINCLCPLVKDKLVILMWLYFQTLYSVPWICLFFHQRPAGNVYSCFICNCRNMETTKISFNWWINCGTFIKWNTIRSNKKNKKAIKRNELSSHEKTCRNIKCTLVSERN